MNGEATLRRCCSATTRGCVRACADALGGRSSLLHARLADAMGSGVAGKIRAVARSLEYAALADDQLRRLAVERDKDAFAAFLSDFRSRVRGLAVGEVRRRVVRRAAMPMMMVTGRGAVVSQMLPFGGGWRTEKGGHALLHVVERTATDRVALAVCNTGGGLEYHPVCVRRFPKVGAATAPLAPALTLVDAALPCVAVGGRLAE
jgi:hypothetical protein